ncbi:tripartite tricarboxylate transporter substrate binding protein [Mycolicibacterium sp. BiH015]|uniref:tripartite tricarboxylate transporter substrate binding protein n=1 Tax=Mycolicibacterium sp. BiH015 TaxID=3018808 RepID=UPI0022E737B9|nr:tripartite tricarboxylate transporter substrate binding protein [Mycolicibacterium sp. BiH015]MDA2892555.1 tripartite tricarboxylate transporter substrate binding protein [Mycolicibacterium sp. BiH015]
MSRRYLHIAVGAAVVTSLALSGCGRPTSDSGGAGGDFPGNKPIELVVAFAPGGAVDTAARLVAPELEESLGTNVEVVNRPGAGGQIGYTELTSAKPDGYTIGATGSPSVVVSPLDPARGAQYTRASFEPLGMQVVDPAVIGVAPDSPYTDLKGLIDAAKASPGSITATTTGIQTGEHFALAQIKEVTGADLAPVHFSEGQSQAVAAFLGNHVPVYVGSTSDVIDLVKQNKIRVLGVMDSQRSKFLPDVPTFQESGFDVISTTARGYSAPAGLPEPVAEKLQSALKSAIENEEVQTKMTDLGLETRYLDPQQYEQLWTEQETTYKELMPAVAQESN